MDTLIFEDVLKEQSHILKTQHGTIFYFSSLENRKLYIKITVFQTCSIKHMFVHFLYLEKDDWKSEMNKIISI